jgi:hypothetical protein
MGNISSIETETLNDGTHIIKILGDENVRFNTSSPENKIVFNNSVVGNEITEYYVLNILALSENELSFPMPSHIPSGTCKLFVIESSRGPITSIYAYDYTAFPPTISDISFTHLDGMSTIDISGTYFISATSDMFNNVINLGNTVVFANSEGAEYHSETISALTPNSISFTSEFSMPDGTYFVTVRNNNSMESSGQYEFPYTAPTPIISDISFTQLYGMSTIDISGMYFSTSSSNKIVFTNSDGEPYGEADIQAQPSNAISLQTSDFTWAISMPSGTYSVTVLNYSTNKTSDPYFFNYTAPPFISTINFTQLQDGRGTIDISGMYFSTEEDGNTIVFANSDEPVPYAELFIQAQSTTELSFTSDIFMPSGTYSSVTVRNNITNMISVQYTSFDYRFTKAIAYVIITAGQFSAVGTTPTINRTFANGLGNPISTPTGLSGTPTYTTSLTGSPLTSSSPSGVYSLRYVSGLSSYGYTFEAASSAVSYTIKEIAYVIITAGQSSTYGATPRINITYSTSPSGTVGTFISNPAGLSGTPTYNDTLTGSIPLTSSSPSGVYSLKYNSGLSSHDYAFEAARSTVPYRINKADAYVIITAKQFSKVRTTPIILKTYNTKSTGKGDTISNPEGLSGTPIYTPDIIKAKSGKSYLLKYLKGLSSPNYNFKPSSYTVKYVKK